MMYLLVDEQGEALEAIGHEHAESVMWCMVCGMVCTMVLSLVMS